MGGNAQYIGESLFSGLMRHARGMNGTLLIETIPAIDLRKGQAFFPQKVKDIGRLHILLSWASHKDISEFIDNLKG
nr:hypothetical protein [uncultured Cohaesibacter sp.]